MAIQFSEIVRKERLDSIRGTIGGGPILRVFAGSPPPNCAAASTGTLLAEMNLPNAFVTAAVAGVVTLKGAWSDTSADATGIAGYFRFFDIADTECHMQGTITAVGGGGDLEVDNINFTAGQPFTVTTFTLTEAGA